MRRAFSIGGGFRPIIGMGFRRVMSGDSVVGMFCLLLVMVFVTNDISNDSGSQGRYSTNEGIYCCLR